MEDGKSMLLECQCHSTEHIMLLSKIDGDFYLTIHLSKHGFFQRVWHAIKYVFGYRCKYGDFEEIIISDEAKKILASSLSEKL